MAKAVTENSTLRLLRVLASARTATGRRTVVAGAVVVLQDDACAGVHAISRLGRCRRSATY
jgi:hypothetical protein